MEIDLWFELLVSLPTAASFVGVFVGGLIFKGLENGYKWIYLYLIAAFLTDLLSRYVDAVFGNNLILVPIFGFIELLLFSIIYYKLLYKSHHRLFKPIIGFLLVIILFDVILCKSSDPENFNSYGRVLDGLTIIFLSLHFYWNTLKSKVDTNTNKLRLNGVILLFALVNSLWFLIANVLVNIEYKVVLSIWIINIIVTSFFYVFLTFQLWHNGKIQKR